VIPGQVDEAEDGAGLFDTRRVTDGIEDQVAPKPDKGGVGLLARQLVTAQLELVTQLFDLSPELSFGRHRIHAPA
jgi:hypothetical protein